MSYVFISFLSSFLQYSCAFLPLFGCACGFQCWSKDDCHLGIEGDKSVFIKTPNSQEVAVYVHPERLPTFPKTWKPLVFLLNSSAATFRLTENLCLVLVRDHDKTMHISCVDYNGGFACAHPATDLAVAYGSYAVKGFEKLEKCDVIPKMATMSGDWGFYIQFFAWGMLVIPKIVELTRPQSVLGAVGMGKRVETIGLIFHPPNMFIQVRLEIPPKTTRTVEFGKDFRVTAKKSSETDIDVYLIIDGQLAKYNYSFDIRVNKPDKPKHNDHIEFKCMIEGDDKKKPDAKYKVTPCKNSTLLLGQGSPSEPGSAQLVSEEVIAFFDAEICKFPRGQGGSGSEEIPISMGGSDTPLR